MKRVIIFLLILSLAGVLACAAMKMGGTKGSEAPAKDKVARDDKAGIKDEESLITSKKKAEEPAEKALKSETRKKAGKKKNGDSIEGAAGLKEIDTPATADRVERKKIDRGAASGLKAGFADDNKQFNYYVHFLGQFGKQVRHYAINIEERIILRVKDKDGRSLPNAKVKISADGKDLCAGKTYADGSFFFFPSEYDKKYKKYTAVISSMQKEKEVTIDRRGKREIPVTFDAPRSDLKNIPLDILFIFDTTGSMGEEINRLKSTIEIINMNLASLSSKPKIRFGMVLYRDRGDDYVTKVVPLTADLDVFQKELEKVSAGGGGDTPEDLQTALHDAMKKIKWNKEGVRLSFIITDAPPHLDYEQEYTYVNAARDARKEAIKIFTVGSGGLDLMGEFVLRQVSQYTYAKYIFLTYGEKGESEGGKEGSVSHHTGANWSADKLEAIILRFAKEELSFVTDQKIEEGEEYFQATKISDEKKEETLQKLYDMAMTQLVDYATFRIDAGTPASVLPISSDKALAGNAEYFTEQLIYTLGKSKTFKMVERKDMQKVLRELEISMTGLVDEANAAKVGKLLGAKMLIMGKLYTREDNYEIFLKLLRVETGEILTVTKLKLDRNLGVKAGEKKKKPIKPVR